jgi:hypothetical protein
MPKKLKRYVTISKEELNHKVRLSQFYKDAIERAIYEMSIPDDPCDAIWPDYFRAEVVNVEADCELLKQLKEGEYETEAGWFQAGWKAKEKHMAQKGYIDQ